MVCGPIRQKDQNDEQHHTAGEAPDKAAHSGQNGGVAFGGRDQTTERSQKQRDNPNQHLYHPFFFITICGVLKQVYRWNDRRLFTDFDSPSG